MAAVRENSRFFVGIRKRKMPATFSGNRHQPNLILYVI
nr:MAG TPA: hypothetical protein [Caudoviricetes sp.]